VLIVIAAWGYFKLFYKTYNTAAVAKTADCIIVLDVKRITNTIIWNWITTPSQWKNISFSSSKNKDAVDWKDMAAIPDYVFVFHAAHQPAGIWYAVLQVKDEHDFEKGLSQFSFEKLGNNSFISTKNGIQFFKAGEKLLVSNASLSDSNYLSQVAREIFTDKNYVSQQTLDKTIAAKSHLAISIAANNFLQEDAVITGNFDKSKIEINGNLSPKKQFIFAENNFSFYNNSLCTLDFTQSSAAVFGLLSNTDKDNISKALNFNIDSVFLQNNQYYSLHVAGIKPRIDSAISYAYDNDFNQVQKVVVNTVQEPAFNFSIYGDSTANIYNYFVSAGKTETTDAGQLFKPMPFVKSYCSIKTNKEFNIVSANYQPTSNVSTGNAVLYFYLLLTKIPGDLLRYLPDAVVKATGNIESIQIKTTKEKEQLNFNCIFQKKNNGLPIINW
jgi:hypothetical protein